MPNGWVAEISTNLTEHIYIYNTFAVAVIDNDHLSPPRIHIANVPFSFSYCGWKKSCTTWDGRKPIKSINNGINHLLDLLPGAGFLPSTVPFHFGSSTALNPPSPRSNWGSLSQVLKIAACLWSAAAEAWRRLDPVHQMLIAMENGHRNSGFSHEKWWIFPLLC